MNTKPRRKLATCLISCPIEAESQTKTINFGMNDEHTFHLDNSLLVCPDEPLATSVTARYSSTGDTTYISYDRDPNHAWIKFEIKDSESKLSS